MLVIIKSAPDTPEGIRGVKFARDMSADIVLLQNGVYFTQGQKLKNTEFTGTVYALEDDKRLRGLTTDDRGDIRDINYDKLVDLMAENDKVMGMF